jgi:TolB protein
MRPRLLSISILVLAACGDDTGPTAETHLTDAIVFVSDRDGYPQLYRMSLDGSEVSYLPQDGTLIPLFPDVSPDGRAIVFHDQHSRIKVQTVDNSDSLIVSPPGFLCAFPTWSPDGARIAMQCSAAPLEQVDIYLVNRDGGAFGALVSSPEDDLTPTWSPDGARIAYASPRDGNLDLHVWDLSTGSDSNLTGTPGVDETFPEWSPDGRLIAFHARSELLEPRSIDLLELSTGEVRRLVDRLQDSYYPDWSPDTRHLVFARNQLPDPLQVVKVDVISGAITEILPMDDALDRYPAYAPASRWAP